MSRRALDGVRILELSFFWAGPYGTRLLADMGAQVLKVESARHPDTARNIGHPPGGMTGPHPWNLSSIFNTRNRGKLSIPLNMATEQGKGLFLKLLKVSDVVLNNYSAHVLQSWGLDYPVLREHKPDIIVLAMPASGMTGPERDYVGMGSNISPLSGLVAITGYKDDVPHGVGAYSDPVAGLTAAAALVSALHYRARTGVGQYIDLSQREASARLIGDIVMDYTMNGRLWPLMGNRHPAWAPHGCYRCKGEDMWVAITVTSDAQWQALCAAAGHPEWKTDPRFADALNRYTHQDELDGLLNEWTAARDHREVMETLQAAGVPAGAVLQTPEMFEDPQFTARGYFPEVPHPEAGTFPMLGVYAKLSKTPGRIDRAGPLLGEHIEYVFCEILGLTREEVTGLIAEEVIC